MMLSYSKYKNVTTSQTESLCCSTSCDFWESKIFDITLSHKMSSLTHKIHFLLCLISCQLVNSCKMSWRWKYSKMRKIIQWSLVPWHWFRVFHLYFLLVCLTVTFHAELSLSLWIFSHIVQKKGQKVANPFWKSDFTPTSTLNKNFQNTAHH